MKSRSRIFYDKSLSAMLTAIEIYNKPDFFYREETFSILAINGWELLFKARILQLDRNRISAITEYERRKNADGNFSSKLYRKKNRSGNHVSIGLFKAADLLANKYGEKIDPLVRANLNLLTEIRDNSIHSFNKDSRLGKKAEKHIVFRTNRRGISVCHGDIPDSSLPEQRFWKMGALLPKKTTRKTPQKFLTSVSILIFPVLSLRVL